MLWLRFIRLGIGLIFVAVPVLAWAVLWPSSPRSFSAQVAIAVPQLVSNASDDASSAAADEPASAELLNHWEYTSATVADWNGFAPMRGMPHETKHDKHEPEKHEHEKHEHEHAGGSMSPVKPMVCGCRCHHM
jgi:hypothetical protein